MKGDKTMRQNAFVQIGKDVDKSRLVEGLPADFVFPVEKRPIFYKDLEGKEQKIEGKSTIVNMKTGKAYGPVSDKYCAITNEEALGAAAYMDGLTLKKYGETQTGIQWLIGELPERTILGDTFKPHLVFRNSFNGTSRIQMAIMPLRIICQNQITMALRGSNISYDVRHTKNAAERMEEAHRMMITAEQFMLDFEKAAGQLASLKINPFQQNAIIKEMFPISDKMSDLQKERAERRVAAFVKAIEEADNANFKGSAWGLINAYADVITHYEPERKTVTALENKFMAITFDPRWMTMLVNAIDRVAA